MNQLGKAVRSVLSAAAISVVALVANAVPVTIGGASISFSWETNPTLLPSITGGYNLTGSGTIEADLNGAVLDLTVYLKNDTLTTGDNPAGKNARLTQFGFGINPNATGVSFVDANDEGMVGAKLDQIPSLKLIEICAYGGQNCSGGADGGIYGMGGSDTFILRLTGNWADLTTVDIDPIGFKYQTNKGSFEFTTSTGTISTTGDVSSPGSSSLALLGLGLMGLGFYRRRLVAAS